MEAMRRLGFSRPVGVLLLVGGLLVAMAGCALASRMLGALPLFGRGPTTVAPVRITGLPVPVVTRPQWTSYTYTGPINDLALSNGLIWAATYGGLVVWDGTGAAARFATEHGLAGNVVTSVAVGADGAIWAGTHGGLSRYDGRAWQTFGAADGLPDGPIYDVVVDRQGLVWAGTRSGLARYDGEAWRVYGSGGLFAALPDDEVYALAVDSANRLWVATRTGLSRLAGGRWTTLTAADGLPDTTITYLTVGPGDVVWGFTKGGLVRIDGQTVDMFAVGQLLEGEAPFRAAAGLAVAPDGWVTIAYTGPAIERYDPLTGDVEPIVVEPPPAFGDSYGALLIDERGTLWLGVGDSVRRFDGSEWVTLSGPSDLPNTVLTDMAHDGRALWVASMTGLARFDGRWQSFGVADGLPTTDTRALAVAPDGALWAAFDTPLRGLARHGPDGWQTITCPTAAPTSATVNGAAQTAEALWFATATGVSRTDGVTWRTFDRRDGLPADPINDVAAHGDTVWAATDYGIARYDGRWRVVSDAAATDLAVAPGGAVWAYGGSEVFRVDGDTARVPLPMPTAVRGLAATDDAIWLATADGVLRYDGAWTVFSPDDGLPTIDVTAIGAGADGRVWAATSGDAGQIEIVVFDGARWVDHPNRDVAAEQLAGDGVTGILAAPNGDVWLKTFGAVERFSGGRWTAFTEEEGLPHLVVNALAWAYDTVWAGTAAGLVRLDGQTWQPFGGPTPEQAGPAVAELAVAPTGELWVATIEGPNRLRVYDGTTWTVVPLPTPTMGVAQMDFTADGRLVAVVGDAGETRLGIYDGQTWAWHASDELGLVPSWFKIAPDGRLWVTGIRPSDPGTLPELVESLTTGSGDNGGQPVVAAFELGPAGIGREIGRYQAADIVVLRTAFAGSLDPIAFGLDGQVYVAGHETVYVFDGSDDIVPVETITLPLPFSRYTFAAEVTPGGHLWVGTSAGAAVWDGQTWRSYYAPPRAPVWWGSATTLLPRVDGGIALGTSGGGLGLYTGRGFTGLTEQSERPAEWEGIFPPITALLYRDAGELWAATDGGGVSRLTATEWQVFTPDATLAESVTALAATDGQLWLGMKTGRATVEPAGDRCRFATVEAGSWVNDVLRDGQGGVWLATDDEGVLRLGDEAEVTQELSGNVRQMALSPNGEVWFADRRQPWLLRYRPDGGEDAWSRLPFDLDLMTPDSLSGLAVGPNLDLWLGGSTTQHGGLVRFSSGRWSRLTTADGLADNWVLHVLVAPDGAVWIATYGGLSRYAP